MSEQSKAANVHQMLPDWPKVRCDRCRTVYTLPEHKRQGLVSGDCPKCHHVIFSTRIAADAAPVTLDFSTGEVRDAD